MTTNAQPERVSNPASPASSDPDRTHVADPVAGVPLVRETRSAATAQAKPEAAQRETVVLPPGAELLDQKFLNAIRIDVLSGPHAGESRVVGAGHEIVVGRSPSSDWQLPNESRLSRRHFQISAHPDHGRVIDLQSTNGTVLNGEKVTEIDLQDGDRIQCGNTVFAIKFQFSSTEPDTRSTVEF
jgi:hypothetical protein